MKILVAALFLICVACGTVVAESTGTATPQPSATLSPTATPVPAISQEVRTCLTILAYLASHHEHRVGGSGHLSNSGEELEQAFAPQIPLRVPPLTLRDDMEDASLLVDRYCARVLDYNIKDEIEEYQDRR